MKLKFVNASCIFEDDVQEYIVLKQGMPVPREGDRVKLPDGHIALIQTVCFDYEKEIITLSFI